jgi:hypothetical protein
MIETHATLPSLTMGNIGILLSGRRALPNQFAQNTLAPYHLIAALGLGTLSATGLYGGDPVCEEGAGVAIAHKTGLNVAEHARH